MQWPLVRSAMSRAIEGFTAKFAVGVAFFITLAGLVLAVMAARSGTDVDRVAPLVAEVLAWGAGVLVCFAASLRAFDRDRDEGWDALLGRHGARAAGYLVSRMTALALVTLLVTALGTLLVGLVALVFVRDGHDAALALRGIVAGVVYGVMFAVVVAPVAVATLAPRGRASGYVYLLAVLVIPALVAPWTSDLVPDDWGQLVSIPGALDSLRESLLGAFDAARLVRALTVLVAVSGLATLWARAQLAIRSTAATADRMA